jgi:superfamily I DNA/RNA helicase
MTAHVEKIDGAPGAGKTTRLFEHVEEEKGDGLAYYDLYYLTFARSSIDEVAAELAEVYPDDDSAPDRARTFHSTALRALDDSGRRIDADNQIITRRSDGELYREFCDRHGLRFKNPDANPLATLQNGQDVEGEGDKLFALNEWLTQKRYPAERHREAPVETPWGTPTARRLLSEWEAFKQSQDPPVYEHGDYVDLAIEKEAVPSVRVLFIDEFQDLSPQEYLLYKTWRDSGRIERIYVAGDANQSIYSFRAARPMYFEETDVDETARLKTSHRCPAAVAQVARGILESTPHTDPQGFRSAEAGGTAEKVNTDTDRELAGQVQQALDDHIPEEGYYDLERPAVFLLTRTNYQAHTVAKALQSAQIPFKWLGRREGAWAEPMPGLLRCLQELRDPEGRIETPLVHKLLNHSADKHRRRQQMGALRGTGYDAEKVRAAYADADTVGEIAAKLDLHETRRDLLRAVLDGDTNHRPDRVRVGTIHGAKGLEAPCVFLFDGYTRNLAEAYRTDTETHAEEHRLYYVGATRASEELQVVTDYFDGQTVPFLDGELPRAGPEVLA